MSKIVVIHIITKLELGGAQQNTLYTVSHLNREKFEPYLICGKGGVLDEEASYSGIPIFFVKELKRKIHPIFDFVAFLKIGYFIRQLKKRHLGSPIIVHTHSSKGGIVGRLAAYLTGLSIIIHTYHGFGFHDFQNRFIKRFYILIEKVIAKITRQAVFVSRNNADRALELGLIQDVPLLIRSGISFKTFRNHRPGNSNIRNELNLLSTTPLVTMIACFKPQKAPLDFILTANHVLKKAPNTHFLLIGDGDLRPAIEAEINKLELKQSLTLLGWRRDVPEILASSNIFVLTSLWEGLPRVLIEARLSSLPIVTTAIEGADEIVENERTGYIVPKKDYLALAEKVLYLLENPSLAKQMGKEGSHVPNEYDIDEMVLRQEKLYLELIEKERR
ncbi:MAG: glycosyltransferase family 4 protein [Nitrospiria bacterium]